MYKYEDEVFLQYYLTKPALVFKPPSIAYFDPVVESKCLGYTARYFIRNDLNPFTEVSLQNGVLSLSDQVHEVKVESADYTNMGQIVVKERFEFAFKGNPSNYIDLTYTIDLIQDGSCTDHGLFDEESMNGGETILLEYTLSSTKMIHVT